MSDAGTSAETAKSQVDTLSQPSLRPSARGRALILIVFVALLGVASLLPAITLEGAATQWRGIELLVLGPMGFKMMQFAWLSNVLALVALNRVMNKPSLLVVVLSGAAFVLAMNTLTLFGQAVPLPNYEGHVVRVMGLGPGFYFWLLALLWPVFAFMLLRVQPAPRIRGEFSG